MCDLIRGRIAHQCEGIRRRGQIGEEAKEVFGIQLGPGEGPGDIHTALHIVGEDGRVDGLCLQHDIH